MEVPVINRFNGLENGMNSLPNPSLLPQILASHSGFDAISQSIDLWKWSAVIITVVATFSGVINRIKLLFFIFRRQKRILEEIVDDSDSDCDFSIDDSVCSVSSWSGFEDDAGAEELEVSFSSRSWDVSDRDFLVKGSDYYLNDYETKRNLRLRHRRSFPDQAGDGNEFSWSDFGGGKSVVKLWDNFRFEFDCCQFDDDGIRVFDVIREQNVGSVFAGKLVMAPPLTAAVLLTAAGDFAGNTTVNLWDTRVGSRMPGLFAEWKPAAGKVAGVNFTGDRKFYLSNEDAGKITVGDVRNVKSALETWFMVSAA